MTIKEAINAAIENLEGVRLPIRDAGNANRVLTALTLLDALRKTVEEQTEQAETQKEDDET